MKFRYILAAVVELLIVTGASAQKQLTSCCENTGEPSQVTATAEGTNVRDGNGNLSDSIPYLLEHARKDEPWAFENLARCYRYGIGTEKSMVNAMIYYDKAGIDEIALAEEAYASDPTDEYGLMNHIMEGLNKKSITFDEALSLLESYPGKFPAWAVRLQKIHENPNVEDAEAYMDSFVDWSADTGDEIVVSIACLAILQPDAPSIKSRLTSPEFMEKIALAAEKIPMLYLVLGDNYRQQYKDCPSDEKSMKKAFEMYHNAYLHGLLDVSGRVEVLEFRDNNPLYDGFPFSPDELARLDEICSKEYRIHYKEFSSGEEVIVEMDEDPVMLESEAY